jgi:FKBP-type peptidyl-prolyl cis-trans isomerase
MPQPSAAAFTAALVALVLVGCSKKEESPSQPDAAEPASATVDNAAASGAATPSTPATGEPFMTDIKTGTGPAITKGQTAVVHYTGWLYSEAAPEKKGQKFDSSRDRNEPFSFPLGAGMVIQGWDEGVVGMQVGSQRRLVIPPEKGYGASGAGGVIPPNATLVFDVELLGIQ